MCAFIEISEAGVQGIHCGVVCGKDGSKEGIAVPVKVKRSDPVVSMLLADLAITFLVGMNHGLGPFHSYCLSFPICWLRSTHTPPYPAGSVNTRFTFTYYFTILDILK